MGRRYDGMSQVKLKDGLHVVKTLDQMTYMRITSENGLCWFIKRTAISLHGKMKDKPDASKPHASSIVCIGNDLGFVTGVQLFRLTT